MSTLLRGRGEGRGRGRGRVSPSPNSNPGQVSKLVVGGRQRGASEKETSLLEEWLGARARCVETPLPRGGAELLLPNPNPNPTPTPNPNPTTTPTPNPNPKPIPTPYRRGATAPAQHHPAGGVRPRVRRVQGARRRHGAVGRQAQVPAHDLRRDGGPRLPPHLLAGRAREAGGLARTAQPAQGGRAPRAAAQPGATHPQPSP